MLLADIKIYGGTHGAKLWTSEKVRACAVTYEFPFTRDACIIHGAGCAIQYSLHTCRLTASRLLRVCDRDVECVCATMLSPIWRALNLSISIPRPMLFHLWSCAMQPMQPPPSSPCNAISPINSPPFKTQKPNSL